MKLFFFTFFLIYGSAHAFLLWRLRMAWPLTGIWAAFAVIWCAIMVCAPLAVRLLERHGHELLARYLALAGYCWMAWLFLFCSLSVVMKLLHSIHRLANCFAHIPRITLLQPRMLVIFCLVAATGITIRGWFEALSIRTEQVRIETKKLPAGSKSIRIVQISDLHVGLIVQEERVRRVIEVIRQANPDLLVSTGDLVDGNLHHFDGVSTLFRELAPALGMLASPGNHEYYVGYRQSKDFTEKSGFRLLRSEALPVGERLLVVGLDDPVGTTFPGFKPNAERTLLADAQQDKFVLLLKHRPELSPESLGRFDLQLSGHVHKGQIFPFNLITWLRFPVRAGTTLLDGGGRLHVNRGTGTWGPPIRFMAPPEVTVIDLVPAKQ